MSADFDDGDDRYEEYKDDLAMGYINEDGSQREPPEPDWDQRAEGEHSWRVHGGGPCDGPEPPRRVIELESGFPRVVVLCGSTRFVPQFREANLRLTLSGVIVLSIGCNLRDAADADVATETGTDPADVKESLDVLHRHKIALADEVLVISDEAGYLGESTRGEIAYANELAKPVRYMHEAALERADSIGLVVKAPF